MMPLPGDSNTDSLEDVKPLAFKYCGGGHGGYAVYVFSSKTDRDKVCRANRLFRSIEPFAYKQFKQLAI